MMSEPARWFLPDRPAQINEFDAFAHDDIAANLGHMIADAPDRTIIGLIGEFGVGKSTVILKLIHRLESTANLRGVVVSAERHQTPGVELHRSLVFSVAEELSHKNLVPSEAVSGLLGNLSTTTADIGPDLAKVPAQQLYRLGMDKFRRLIFYSSVMLVLAASAAVGISFYSKSHPRSWVSTTEHKFATYFGIIFVTFLAFLQVARRILGLDKWLSAWLAPDWKMRAQAPPEAADEFERVFRSLLECCRFRLVIAVDDIDRLPADNVIDVLNAIRSFQYTCVTGKRPIFIISCDEQVVHEAIRRASPPLSSKPGAMDKSISDYLDRLFTIRQHMPPLGSRDLLEYAIGLTSQYNHSAIHALGPELEASVAVLIHDRVDNPRHVLRLLNTFFANYLLAVSRESHAGVRGIRNGDASAHPRVIARLTVLQVDYPEFYRALQHDYNLIRELDEGVRPSTAYSTIDNSEDSISLRFPDIAPSLLSFWRRTAGWVEAIDAPAVFLRHGQDRFEQVLGSSRAQRIYTCIINNDVEYLSVLIREGLSSSVEELTAISEIACFALDSCVALELINVLDISTKVIWPQYIAVVREGSTDDSNVTDLANAIARAVGRGTAGLHPEIAADIAEQLSDDRLKQTIFDAALRSVRFAFDGSDEEKALTLVRANISLLSRRLDIICGVPPGLLIDHLHGHFGMIMQLRAPEPAISEWVDSMLPTIRSGNSDEVIRILSDTLLNYVIESWTRYSPLEDGRNIDDVYRIVTAFYVANIEAGFRDASDLGVTCLRFLRQARPSGAFPLIIGALKHQFVEEDIAGKITSELISVLNTRRGKWIRDLRPVSMLDLAQLLLIFSMRGGIQMNVSDSRAIDIVVALETIFSNFTFEIEGVLPGDASSTLVEDASETLDLILTFMGRVDVDVRVLDLLIYTRMLERLCLDDITFGPRAVRTVTASFSLIYPRLTGINATYQLGRLLGGALNSQNGHVSRSQLSALIDVLESQEIAPPLKEHFLATICLELVGRDDLKTMGGALVNHLLESASLDVDTFLGRFAPVLRTTAGELGASPVPGELEVGSALFKLPWTDAQLYGLIRTMHSRVITWRPDAIETLLQLIADERLDGLRESTVPLPGEWISLLADKLASEIDRARRADETRNVRRLLGASNSLFNLTSDVIQQMSLGFMLPGLSIALNRRANAATTQETGPVHIALMIAMVCVELADPSASLVTKQRAVRFASHVDRLPDQIPTRALRRFIATVATGGYRLSSGRFLVVDASLWARLVASMPIATASLLDEAVNAESGYEVDTLRNLISGNPTLSRAFGSL